MSCSSPPATSVYIHGKSCFEVTFWNFCITILMITYIISLGRKEVVENFEVLYFAGLSFFEILGRTILYRGGVLSPRAT